jgi:hypothetical protein
MSLAATPDETCQAARRRQALAAGLLYAANVAAILSSIWLLRGIIVPRDPAATAAHVAAHAALLRVALGLELVSTAASIGVAALLYRLLKPVSASVSATAAFFRLAACAVAIMGYVFQFAPLELLADGRRIPGLDPAQLTALALALFRLHGLASNIVILLFGFHFGLIGWLVYRSGFLPRALGLLAGVTGVGAMLVLSPSLSATLFPYFAGVGLLNEVSLAVSLLVIGRPPRPPPNP